LTGRPKRGSCATSAALDERREYPPAASDY